MTGYKYSFFATLAADDLSTSDDQLFKTCVQFLFAIQWAEKQWVLSLLNPDLLFGIPTICSKDFSDGAKTQLRSSLIKTAA